MSVIDSTPSSTSPPEAGTAEANAEPSLFEEAIGRYNAGAPAGELIADFQTITQQAPRQSAGWTCLAWLQLLDGQPLEALRAARTAVRLNPQDPQARVNLSLAMLETGAKGVRRTHRPRAAGDGAGSGAGQRTGGIAGGRSAQATRLGSAAEGAGLAAWLRTRPQLPCGG